MTSPWLRSSRPHFASAVAARKPFVVVFATPKFCKTAQCGPTLDRVKPIAAAHPDVTFINVEPYQLEPIDGQLQPVLTGDPPDLTTATARCLGCGDVSEHDATLLPSSLSPQWRHC